MLAADPDGREYFGKSLWLVSDADVHRYQICVEVARAIVGRAFSPAKR